MVASVLPLLASTPCLVLSPPPHIAVAPRLAAPARAFSRARHAPPQLLEPPLPLGYDVPAMPKPFADYEWDPEFPGSFKPGTRGENQNLDEVLAEWEGRDNPACMQLPQDQLWQVPLAPPEDILSWLKRIGLLEEEDALQDEEEMLGRGDSLLDDEFDLDEEAMIEGGEQSSIDGMDA